MSRNLWSHSELFKKNYMYVITIPMSKHIKCNKRQASILEVAHRYDTIS